MGKAGITTDAVIRRIEDIVAGDIDNEKVMMSLEKGEYFALDPIGSRIWEMLENPVKVKDVIDTLLQKYDVDRATCEHDVLIFLEEMHESGILQVTQ